MLYICAKFHEIISNGIKVIERYQSYRADTISIGKIIKGNNSAKNADGATVVNLFLSSVMLYIPTKFCEIISNGIKLERTPFLYWKLQREINSQKMKVE